MAGGAALATGWCVPRAWGAAGKGSFVVEGDHFALNGRPFQVIAGEMHYARIPREYWTHRIQMAKAMGLNTIATYVFWNVHEPRPGEYEFGGNYDVAGFIRAVQAEGLNVLLRAGPYSCAEWEFGGFPAWLLKDPKMKTALRTTDAAFIVPAERWLKRLAQETAPLLIANGGPIIAVQIENEYGNFSNDPKYMQGMLRIFQSTGWKDSLLYTVDPSKALANGCLDGILAGVNFGTGNAEHGLAALAALRPAQPLFATEYWPGWFDLWGHPHETRPVVPQLKDIEYVLNNKGSINIYMFHGGTSFGMMAGASASTGNYRGNVTSYDYDAPLDEAGHTTAKFFAYRDLILKYSGGKALPVPETAKVVEIHEFEMRVQGTFQDYRPAVKSELPLTMEQMDQSFGYINYRTTLSDDVHDGVLAIDPVHDYVQVYIQDDNRARDLSTAVMPVLIATLDRHYGQTTVKLDAKKGAVLEILVENTGRLNSTKAMRDEWKGVRSVMLNGVPLTDWEISSAPMDRVPEYWMNGLDALPETRPHTLTGSFKLATTGDAFLDVSELGKGLLWINGRLLGRFWNIGPQQTLYVPAPWLKVGKNDVVAFDMLPAKGAPKLERNAPWPMPSKDLQTAKLRGGMKPILDGPTPGYENDPERKKKDAPDAEFGPKLAKPAGAPEE
jgi:beta-galactosidase